MSKFWFLIGDLTGLLMVTKKRPGGVTSLPVSIVASTSTSLNGLQVNLNYVETMLQK